MVDARHALRNCYWGRARALDALSRYAEATHDWERALELDDGQETEKLRSGLAVSRLRRFRKDKDAAGCLTAVGEFEALKRTDAGGLYNRACYRAICAAVIPHDPKTPAADATRLANEQADRAMAGLKKAVNAGFLETARSWGTTKISLNHFASTADFKSLPWRAGGTLAGTAHQRDGRSGDRSL